MSYTGLTAKHRKEMLGEIGVSSVEELYGKILGEDIALDMGLATSGLLREEGRSELEVERDIDRLARKNKGTSQLSNFLGGGSYLHHQPALVDYIIQRGEFMTSYTPYQAEISQGTLQYLFEFQTQVSRITGLEISNASMWDGSTATAEGILMGCRISKRRRVIVSGGLHPHYIGVIKTYTKHNGIEVKILEPTFTDEEEDCLGHIDDSIGCIVVQYPDFFGRLRNYEELSKKCQRHGVQLVMTFTEVTAFGVLESCGSYGADIVVGEGQSLGNPLGYGGPYLGLMSTRGEHVRQLPGRLAGMTVDTEGKRGYVLALSTREQHIKRHKATSNICTNAGLCALAFTVHCTLLGERGYRDLASLNHSRACYLWESLRSLGLQIDSQEFYNEFPLTLPSDSEVGKVLELLYAKEILGGIDISKMYRGYECGNRLLVTATEMTSKEEIDNYIEVLGEILGR